MRYRKRISRKMRLQASYTAEMTLLLPVLLLALFLPVFMGYQMYGQTKRASACGWDETFCAEDRVRKIKFAGSVLEELK